MTTNTKHVNCPSCQKEVTWTEKNQYRPFCSERCRMQDLANWATASYTVSSPLTEADENFDNVDSDAESEDYA